MPYLSASAVMIHYEEALYQVYASKYMQLLEISRTGDMADDEVFIVIQEEQISFGNNSRKGNKKGKCIYSAEDKRACIKFDGSGKRSGS